jgi:hypothetical protein
VVFLWTFPPTTHDATASRNERQISGEAYLPHANVHVVAAREYIGAIATIPDRKHPLHAFCVVYLLAVATIVVEDSDGPENHKMQLCTCCDDAEHLTNRHQGIMNATERLLSLAWDQEHCETIHAVNACK